MKTLTIRILDPRLQARLDRAGEEGWNLSQITRNMLEDFFEDLDEKAAMKETPDAK